jgi:hypothetical protein
MNTKELMAGNPHHREADRSELGEAVFVQTQAVLAVAYEQRTANLLAWAALDPEQRMGPLANEIRERMGRK